MKVESEKVSHASVPESTGTFCSRAPGHRGLRHHQDWWGERFAVNLYSPTEHLITEKPGWGWFIYFSLKCDSYHLDCISIWPDVFQTHLNMPSVLKMLVNVNNNHRSNKRERGGSFTWSHFSYPQNACRLKRNLKVDDLNIKVWYFVFLQPKHTQELRSGKQLETAQS